MPSQEEIEEQQKLLETNRRTLHIYLHQRDELGSAYAPPGTIHGIRNARANIARIKGILRGWGVEVPEHPDDEETRAPQPAQAFTEQKTPVDNAPSSSLQKPMVLGIAIAVVAIMVIGSYIITSISARNRANSNISAIGDVTTTPIAVVPTAIRTIEVTTVPIVPTSTPQLNTPTAVPATPPQTSTPSPTQLPSPTQPHTPVPTPPPTQFTDNFEDAMSTLSNWTIVKGLWEIKDGKHYCFLGTRQDFATTLAGVNDWKDYTFSVDVMATGAADKTILFRYLDGINTYQINFRAAPYNDMILTKGTGSNPRLLKQVSVENHAGFWYNLKIMVEGNVIRAYVDDTLCLSYLDDASPLLNGGIGLVAHSSDKDIAISFDNVSVTLNNH
jgi:hypothetical protein